MSTPASVSSNSTVPISLPSAPIICAEALSPAAFAGAACNDIIGDGK